MCCVHVRLVLAGVRSETAGISQDFPWTVCQRAETRFGVIVNACEIGARQPCMCLRWGPRWSSQAALRLPTADFGFRVSSWHICCSHLVDRRRRFEPLGRDAFFRCLKYMADNGVMPGHTQVPAVTLYTKEDVVTVACRSFFPPVCCIQSLATARLHGKAQTSTRPPLGDASQLRIDICRAVDHPVFFGVL